MNEEHKIIRQVMEAKGNMKASDVSLTDVADNCPKQQRTLDVCRKALQYAKEKPELLDEFLRTKRLPVARLCEGGGNNDDDKIKKFKITPLLEKEPA